MADIFSLTNVEWEKQKFHYINGLWGIHSATLQLSKQNVAAYRTIIKGTELQEAVIKLW